MRARRARREPVAGRRARTVARVGLVLGVGLPLGFLAAGVLLGLLVWVWPGVINVLV